MDSRHSLSIIAFIILLAKAFILTLQLLLHVWGLSVTGELIDFVTITYNNLDPSVLITCINLDKPFI